jgi:hypothetical protein
VAVDGTKRVIDNVDVINDLVFAVEKARPVPQGCMQGVSHVYGVAFARSTTAPPDVTVEAQSGCSAATIRSPHGPTLVEASAITHEVLKALA